jgi:hypothetical protein
VGGELGDGELADRAEAGDLGVVVDGEAGVGGQADIELDAVGAAAAGLGEGVQGVLDEAVLGATPVGKDADHLVHISVAKQVKKFTKTPCGL